MNKPTKNMDATEFADAVEAARLRRKEIDELDLYPHQRRMIDDLLKAKSLPNFDGGYL